MKYGIRTRFAPSPTGLMHIGNLRTALYAYLFAKKHSGVFVLRIEDTDQERLVENAVEIIYNTLKCAGLSHDEGPDKGGQFGPYVQSERIAIYRRHAQELVEKGNAYYCFCNKDRLDSLVDESGNRRYDKHCLHLSQNEINSKLADGVPHVIRQNVPEEGTTSFTDLVFGNIPVENKELQDIVLLKSDGFPTYNFANVVDDHLMKISHVFRGMEYISSTPVYNLLYESFGWEIPQYVHLPHIMRDKQHKLSKRHGDANFEDFLRKGFLPAAILNYVALLGWNPKTEAEKFTMSELVEAFDISGISKSSAIFDEVKLRWLNSLYMKELPPETFSEMSAPYYDSIITVPMDRSMLDILLQPRVSVISDIPDLLKFINDFDDFNLDFFENKAAKSTKEFAAAFLPQVLADLQDIKEWNNDNLFASFEKLTEQAGLKKKQTLWAIRIAVSGQISTPGGASEICALLGKDITLRRLANTIVRLNG
jgi:glutamyl-tRNA synthetase